VGYQCTLQCNIYMDWQNTLNCTCSLPTHYINIPLILLSVQQLSVLTSVMSVTLLQPLKVRLCTQTNNIQDCCSSISCEPNTFPIANLKGNLMNNREYSTLEFCWVCFLVCWCLTAFSAQTGYNVPQAYKIYIV